MDIASQSARGSAKTHASLVGTLAVGPCYPNLLHFNQMPIGQQEDPSVNNFTFMWLLSSIHKMAFILITLTFLPLSLPL